MRRVLYIFLAAFIGLVFMPSCVKEDRSACPTSPTPTPPTPTPVTQTLKLMFVPRQMDITPTQDDLKSAMVYVFDGAGAIYRTWTQTSPALNTTYDTGITLGGDTYRLVAWINHEAPYRLSTDPTPTTDPTTPVTPVRSVTRSALTDGRLSLIVPENLDITEQIPMLFYGSAEQIIAPTSDTTVEVPLTLDTYDLTVTVRGVPMDGSQYRLQVNDTNGAYDFNNNFIETTGFDYQGFTTAGTGGGTGDVVLKLRTLRLAPNRNPMISIVNMTTGQVVFPSGAGTTGSTNLMNLINQTGVDLATTFRLNIEVTPPSTTTDETTATITVTINGWRVVLDGGIVVTNE